MLFPWGRESPDPACKHPCFFCYNDSMGMAWKVPEEYAKAYPEISEPLAMCDRCSAESKDYSEEIASCLFDYVRNTRDIQARDN